MLMLRSYKLERRYADGVALELADELEQGQLLVLMIGALELVECAQVEYKVVVQGLRGVAVHSLG